MAGRRMLKPGLILINMKYGGAPLHYRSYMTIPHRNMSLTRDDLRRLLDIDDRREHMRHYPQRPVPQYVLHRPQTHRSPSQDVPRVEPSFRRAQREAHQHPFMREVERESARKDPFDQLFNNFMRPSHEVHRQPQGANQRTDPIRRKQEDVDRSAEQRLRPHSQEVNRAQQKENFQQQSQNSPDVGRFFQKNLDKNSEENGRTLSDRNILNEQAQMNRRQPSPAHEQRNSSIQNTSKLTELEEKLKALESELQIAESELESAKNQLNTKDNQIEELGNSLQISQSNYKYQLNENTRLAERYQQELQKAKDFAISKFAGDLLEIRDNMHLALAEAQKFDIKNDPDIGNCRQYFKHLYNGVDMTSFVFDKIMTRHGITEYVPTGEKFDPNYHEAISTTSDPNKPQNEICEVLRSGWKIGDRILRASQVVVNK